MNQMRLLGRLELGPGLIPSIPYSPEQKQLYSHHLRGTKIMSYQEELCPPSVPTGPTVHKKVRPKTMKESSKVKFLEVILLFHFAESQNYLNKFSSILVHFINLLKITWKEVLKLLQGTLHQLDNW